MKTYGDPENSVSSEEPCETSMRGTCLVIMPFVVRDADRSNYPENHWEEVYGALLRPAVDARNPL
jgi:hypothetical protein